jgi:urea transport system permease protein
MMLPRAGLAALLLAVLTLAPDAAPAAEGDGVAALVPGLGERRLSSVEETVDALAAAGGDDALAVLRALRDGELAASRDGTVVRVTDDGALVEPLGGAPVTALEPGDVREIRVSNRIRRALSSGIAELSLGSEDVAVRRTAAERFLAAPDPALRGRLEAALEREPDAGVREVLELAVTVLVAADPDATEAARVAAIEDLETTGSVEARSRLLELDLPAESRLDLRRREAVAVIDRTLERWGYAQNLWYGLSLGSVLLLAALGLAITFGVMGVINMAHGEMVMIGAYTTWLVQSAFRAWAPGAFDGSLLLALPTAFVVAAAVGIVIERTVIRRLYGRPLETLLATFGISLILQQAVRTLFGASNRPVEAVSWMSGAFELGHLTITYNRLWILLFSLAVLASVAAILRRTALGLHIRAVTQNRAMAEDVGIRSDRVDMATFGLGSGIAGVAGVALSQIENVSPNLGQAYIIDSFMVIVFGGVGNLLGTLFGAMTLGITSKAVEPWLGAVAAKVLILVFIIVFIQFRPKGLFPQKGRAAE